MPDSLAEKLYYRLPVFLQNCAFSLYGWHTSRKRYNRHFHEQLARLEQTQWWSAAQIRAFQDEQVALIVRHAYDTVPFYRRWYDENGVDVRQIRGVDDLQRLPILTKQLVRQHQREMVSSAFPSGGLIQSLTSGTTGTPLTIYQTRDALAFRWAVWWRHKGRFGLKPTDRHLTFGARIPIDQNQARPPYWRSDYINNRVYLSTYHVSRRTVRDIVNYLNSTRFEFYEGYPSAMYVLATLMRENGLRLCSRPRHVVTGSDALLPHHAEEIGEVFGAPVTEQYGMAEFAGNLSKCEQGRFHVDFECCHVETLPRSGSDFHSLILTGWGNPAMPFIRYEVGDFGRPVDTPCGCGRQSACLSSIDGRLEDYVVTPDGRRLIGMNQVFEYAKNAREIQIYQSMPASVEFRIVPNPGFGQTDKDALIREFRRRGGGQMEISFRIVETLERSSSGKLKAVISEVKN